MNWLGALRLPHAARDRVPVSAEEIATVGAGPYLGQPLVFFLSQEHVSSPCAGYPAVSRL